VWILLARTIPLHAFLFMAFLGEMITRRRVFKTTIGVFVVSRAWM
jgi:hypothetical protein